MLKALSHPVRIGILELLTEWPEGSPTTMATELGYPLSNVAYHTRILHLECQCLDQVRMVRRRGAYEHFYRVRPDPFMWSVRPTGIPQALQGAAAASALGKLVNAAVGALTKRTFQRRKDATLSCGQMVVDEQGWSEICAGFDRFSDIAKKAQKNSTRRLSGKPGISIVVGVHGFEIPPSSEDAAP
jgi:hypothetical protein